MIFMSAIGVGEAVGVCVGDCVGVMLGVGVTVGVLTTPPSAHGTAAPLTVAVHPVIVSFAPDPVKPKVVLAPAASLPFHEALAALIVPGVDWFVALHMFVTVMPDVKETVQDLVGIALATVASMVLPLVHSVRVVRVRVSPPGALGLGVRLGEAVLLVLGEGVVLALALGEGGGPTTRVAQ
jgi:hypothetical protein